jgi:hypothetical protein
MTDECFELNGARVRGDPGMSPQAKAALGQVIDVVRRQMEARPPEEQLRMELHQALALRGFRPTRELVDLILTRRGIQRLIDHERQLRELAAQWAKREGDLENYPKPLSWGGGALRVLAILDSES